MTTSNSSLNIEKCVRNKIRLDKIWAMTIIYGKTPDKQHKAAVPFRTSCFRIDFSFCARCTCAMDGQDTWPSHRFKVLNSTAVPGYPGIDIGKSYLSTGIYTYFWIVG